MANSTVYELRTYYAAPGKLDALQARFRDHTVGLFDKHGLKVIGFWVPTVEDGGTEDTLVYLLAFDSREAAHAAWGTFRDDPDWVQARKESEADGPLVAKLESVFLAPTDYSPLQ